VLASCTSSKARAPRRLLSVRPQHQYEALQAARKRQATKGFSKRYALRSGIEAMISEASSCLWFTTITLSRLSQDPPPACRHGCSYQLGSCSCLVRRGRTRSHTRISFPKALRCGLGGFPNSVSFGDKLIHKCDTGTKQGQEMRTHVKKPSKIGRWVWLASKPEKPVCKSWS